jgi:hypothetical protein
MDGELLTVREMAAKLRVPHYWVYSRARIRETGGSPHLRCGKYARFDFGAVLACLGMQREQVQWTQTLVLIFQQ